MKLAKMNKLSVEDRTWVHALPDASFSTFSSFKQILMVYLLIPADHFDLFDVPEVWKEAFQKEVRHRFK